MALVEIMRAGTHIAMSGVAVQFSDDDLALAAAAYSPERRRAPLVLGHPSDDVPAFGVVSRLIKAGGKLIADITDIAKGAEELVRAGRYKRISASFLRPTHPSNPVPGAYYLKHIGLLGAAAPAVKGLESPAFTAPGAAPPLLLEFSSSNQVADFSSGETDFSAPSGYAVDAERVELHQLARRLQRTVAGLDYLEAARLASGSRTT